MEAITHYPVCVPVVEESQVGNARRAAVSMASALGFDEQRRGQAAIVVSELATNLARHAKGGEIILRSLDDCDRLGLEVMSIDRGPGIRNVAEAMRDGFSTFGTPGNGLGAAQRVAATFDLWSSAVQSSLVLATIPPPGTVICARIQPGRPKRSMACDPETGVVCLPVGRETACGDSWDVQNTSDGRTMILVADGLGHGIHAAEASRQAVKVFRDNLMADSARFVDRLHDGLRGTRGAAIAVAELRPASKELLFTGVGNISGFVFANGTMRSVISHNGTVGAELRRVQTFTYPWPDTGLLILHSDGLTSQWQLGTYPGLQYRHPSLIAGVLYRDFRRERDDVTVLAVRAKARRA